MSSTSAARVLTEAVRAFLPSEGQGPWAVGYSGGRDSAVLLEVLVRVAGPDRVVALHVDHGWRPEPERIAEARLVAEVCARLGVVLRPFGPPEPGVARTEAAARRHRYACFGAFTTEHPGALVFLAHHAQDQAETILMRLLRGRSWQGLAGMPAERGPYRRPFLTVEPEVLAAYAQVRGLAVHLDSTNLSDRPDRNYLRRQVYPLLQRRWPAVTGALTLWGRLWRGALATGPADARWQAWRQGARLGVAVWDAWSELERQAQLLALAAREGAADRPSRRLVEAAAQPGRTRAVQGSGWRWSRGQTHVVWQPVVQRPVKEYFTLVQGPGAHTLGRRRFVVGPDTTPGLGPGMHRVALEADRPWVLRSGQRGLAVVTRSEGTWTKRRRRERLAGRAPEATLLVLQDGTVRAVLDATGRRLLWAESPVGPWPTGGICITFVSSSTTTERP